MYWPWLVQKGHLMPKLTYNSTTSVLIFAFVFQPFPNAYWDGNLPYSRRSPVILGPDPYPDLLSPLYVIVRPGNWILLFAATRKEYHIGGLALTVFELWPFKI